MLLALFIVCGLVACALVAATFAATADAYPHLPDKVPLHIGLNGTVDGWGPRPAIWMLPVVQLLTTLLLLAVITALSLHLPNTHGSPRGACVIGICVLAILWRAQKLLLELARNKGDRVDLTGIWIWFALLPVAIAAAVVLG